MAANGFKHISVAAPEDDDVVIRAGSKDPDERSKPAPAGGRRHEGDGAGFDAEPPDARPETTASQPRDAHVKPPARDDLADLEGEPMPFVQKAVIVAAVVCIIGAIAYYLLVMG